VSTLLLYWHVNCLHWDLLLRPTSAGCCSCNELSSEDRICEAVVCSTDHDV
jgi:hypothetical protein